MNFLKKSKLVFLSCFFTVTLAACSNGAKIKSVKKELVSYGTDDIKNVSATVCVYVEEDNKPPVISSMYEMYVEEDENGQKVRLDFPGYGESKPVSVLSSGSELVVMETESGTILSQSRTVEASSEKERLLNRIIGSYSFGKVNKEAARAVASEFTVHTDSKKNEMTIEIPSEYFDNENERRLSTKAIYDCESGLLKEVEVVTEQKSGYICTSSSWPEYDVLENGNYVKTGLITVIQYKNVLDENDICRSVIREVYSDIKINKGTGSEFRAIEKGECR